MNHFKYCKGVFFLALISSQLFASQDIPTTTAKLRQYCAGCHAVGEVRFIYSDDDAVLWQDLFTKQAPKSKKPWNEAIMEVLNWPKGTPPPFDQLFNPPSKDWMPKGKKRLDLANDTVQGKAVREIILESLASNHLARRLE